MTILDDRMPVLLPHQLFEMGPSDMMMPRNVWEQDNVMRVGPFGVWELLAILAIILLIFGAKRLPEIGSSLGKGIRTFKSAVTGEEAEEPQTHPINQNGHNGREDDRS